MGSCFSANDTKPQHPNMLRGAGDESQNKKTNKKKKKSKKTALNEAEQADLSLQEKRKQLELKKISNQ